jgi:hypothetical protein
MTTALEGGEESSSRPGRSLPPGKDPVPIVQQAGWAPGPVWTGEENLVTTEIRSRTVQPVASHYTDWVTRPTCFTQTPSNLPHHSIFRNVNHLCGNHNNHPRLIKIFLNKMWDLNRSSDTKACCGLSGRDNVYFGGWALETLKTRVFSTFRSPARRTGCIFFLHFCKELNCLSQEILTSVPW